MQIGRAAREAGVSVKTVRHWEVEGLLPQVSRRGPYRRFDAEHVARLQLIAHCRRQGFSIPEIRRILDLLPAEGCPDPIEMHALVRGRLDVVRAKITALRCQEARLEATANYLIRRMGP
jgi:MerR family copper efflux transcriptional regulator